MPTRAATAAAAAATMRTTRSRKAPTQTAGKENDVTTPISSSTKGKEKAAPKKPARGVKAKKVEEVFCSCRGLDDGTPMVQCGTCDEWYHFRCINLSEDDASEIMVYVCPSCQEKTGRRTVSKYQKTTRTRQLHYPLILSYCCTLPSCNNPRLRLLVPVFVAIRLGTGTLPLRRLSCMCLARTSASCIHRD